MVCLSKCLKDRLQATHVKWATLQGQSKRGLGPPQAGTHIIQYQLTISQSQPQVERQAEQVELRVEVLVEVQAGIQEGVREKETS